jgi:PilZ domain
MGYFPERRHPRFEFQTFPWVLSVTVGEPCRADKPTRIEAKNVSQGGLKFLSNRKFQLFENVQISLFEKGTGKTLVALGGKVVRVEEIDTGFGERTYGIAMQFLTNTQVLGALLPPKADSPQSTGQPPGPGGLPNSGSPPMKS